MKRRTLLATALLPGLATALLPGLARAQAPAWPDRPVRIIIPFPAGGPTDVAVRLLAEALGRQLPQRVLVENRPGAGSLLGTEVVAKGPRDGSVFLTATVAHAVNPALYARLPYDPERDFRGVGLIGTVPLLVVVPQSSPVKDLPDLLVMLRERPGGHDYGSAGNGSAQHIGAELLKSMAGVQANHIPYRGNPTALTDLAAGRLAFVIESMATTLPQVRGGTLRALAVTAPARVKLAPEVPAVAETLPGYSAWTWNAILAPSGVPEEAVTGMSAAMNAVLPGLVPRLEGLGLDPKPGLSPAEVDGFIAAESAKWQGLMRAAGIRAD
ncbi:tripartite tricarboxylate transporter substrate binding protein [Belnapia sp. T6]|uniref:Tripartite tricarboxylate transporter substrate binding protein n=1 Tax=Belnapia mucosa TaxID=2804532 RepID=A0ABS1V7Z1_9PROT|nr:tripartite tricarboxylate transporter substrate-binding protein [Belnapia mucosa]MBL6457786.1 tripartite tricarboxylate transporter substrate binding protein [Belnapia mucosa]